MYKAIHGIELWNGLSELKTVVPTKLHGLFYAFFPQFIGHGPILETIQQLGRSHVQRETRGCHRRLGCARTSHAHGTDPSRDLSVRLPLQTVNTHVFIPEPLTGDVLADKKMIYEAIANGHCFVAYDLPAPTRGFRFKAKGSKEVKP